MTSGRSDYRQERHNIYSYLLSVTESLPGQRLIQDYAELTELLWFIRPVLIKQTVKRYSNNTQESAHLLLCFYFCNCYHKLLHVCGLETQAAKSNKRRVIPNKVS